MDNKTRLLLERDLLCARIELERMLAENKERDNKGESPAYSAEDIQSIINDYGVDYGTFAKKVLG